MARRVSFIALIFLLSVPGIGQNDREGSREKKFTLTVVIKNIKKVAGEMQVGLYNNAEDFPKVDRQYKLVVRKVEEKVFTYSFRDLPSGDYALAVFQDIDSDGRIDKNLIGVPKEPYGFSNDIKPRLSAPPFDKTKFRLDTDKTVTITLFD